MQGTYSILMAEAFARGKSTPDRISRSLGLLVSSVNAMHHDSLLSPFTLVSDKSFQGVMSNPSEVLNAIFTFDRLVLRYRLTYKLRYVFVQGEVTSALDPELAMPLTGTGVDLASELLTRKARSKPRVQVRISDDSHEQELNDLFFILDGLSARWKAKDATLLHDLLKVNRVADIATRHGKNRGQIYKRRNTLQTEEYLVLRNYILNLGRGMEA